MGSASFIKLGKGKNSKEVFNYLVEKAEEEYGNNSYNGQISTCSLGRKSYSYEKYHESNHEKSKPIIKKELEYISSGECRYIDLGIISYEIISVELTKQEYSAKFKMKYMVKDMYNNICSRCETITQAKLELNKIAMRNPNNHFSISKEYDCIGNVNLFSSRTTKVYKDKKPTKVKENQIVNEIHEYIFFGWAKE